MKRISTAILIVMLCWVALPAHADIVIGLAGPTTGTNAAWGEIAARGAQQAIADINAQGGVDNQKLVLKIADDACDPKQAVSIANQFASSGVKFVFGHACSSASIPASKIYNEENIVMVSALSTNPALTDSGYKTVFRVCGRDDQQGLAQANYILKNFRSYRIGIIHDNSTGGRGQAEVFQRTLNAAGVKEALFDSYTPGEKDYSALVTKLKGDGIQLLDIGGYYTEAALIARQIKQQKADIQIIGGDALVTDEFWKIAGDAGEGVLMTFEPDTRNLPEAQNVVAEFRKANYEPAGYTLYGYAAIQVMAQAIKLAGYPDPVKAAASMHKNTFDTVIGKIGFDAKGDVTGSSYVVYRWHNGKYAQVTN
jgi:branched-chain amino acid transport system substrate-binding protein